MGLVVEKRSQFLICIVFLIVFLIGGCQSLEKNEDAPDWLKTVVEEDENFYYFYLNASVTSNKASYAYRKIAEQLSSRLLHLTGHAYRSYDEAVLLDYLTDLSLISINRKLAGIDDGEGFFVKDIFYLKRKSDIRKIFILVAFEKEGLDQFQFQLKPNSSRRAVLGWSDPWSNIKVYWNAAVAAAEFDVPDNALFVEKYLERVIYNLNALSIDSISSPELLYFFKPNPVPFSVVILTDKDVPVVGSEIAVVWRTLSAGVSKWNMTQLKADSDGMVQFILPPVTFDKGGRVGFELSRKDILYPVDRISSDVAKRFDDVLQQVRSKSVIFDLPVLSNAKNKKTAVLFFQYDNAGKITSDKSVESIFVGTMNESEFQFESLSLVDGVIPIPELILADEVEDSLESSSVDNLFEKELIDLFLAQLDGTYDRLLVGHGKLDSFVEEGALFQSSVSGQVDLYSMDGTTLFSYTTEASSRGNNAEIVINLAWKSLGRNFTDHFIENLP